MSLLFFCLDLLTLVIFDAEYKFWNSLLSTILHHPLISSLLGPNILLKNLFSKTLCLCSFLKARHPYKTGKTVVLYTVICMFSGDAKTEGF